MLRQNKNPDSPPVISISKPSESVDTSPKVGVTLIVLLKSQLITLSEPDQFAGFWLLGLCIIAGFGVDEFVNRLFYLSRTLFGEPEVRSKVH